MCNSHLNFQKGTFIAQPSVGPIWCPRVTCTRTTCYHITIFYYILLQFTIMSQGVHYKTYWLSVNPLEFHTISQIVPTVTIVNLPEAVDFIFWLTNIPIYIYIYTQVLTRTVNWIIFRIHWYCSAIPFHYICISWPILEYSTPEILPWLNSGIFSDFLSRFHTYACNTVTRHPDNLTEITELKLSPWEKSDCFSNIDK